MLYVAALLYAVSAIASALAPSFWFLVVARMIGRHWRGCLSHHRPDVHCRVSAPGVRGRLVSFNQLNIVLGISVAFFSNYLILQLGLTDAAWTEALAFGAYNWRWMLGLETLPAILYFFSLFAVPERETVKYWVFRVPRHGIGELELGGLFVYFYAILVWGCFQYTDEQLRSSQPPPAFLRFPGQLVNHHQCRVPAAASLGLPCTFPYGRKRGLNGIRSPKVNPVFGRELVEG